MSFQAVSIMLQSDLTSPNCRHLPVLSFLASVWASVLDLSPYVHRGFRSLQRSEAVRWREGWGEVESWGEGRGEAKGRQSLKEFSSFFFSDQLPVLWEPSIFWDTLLPMESKVERSVCDSAPPLHVSWHDDYLRHCTLILLFLTKILNCCLDLGPSPTIGR